MDQRPASAREPSQEQIYFRTRLGEQALAEPMRLLQYNLRRALALVDGRSTTAQVVTRFGDPVVGRAALADLLRAGLIGTDVENAPTSASTMQSRRAAAAGPAGASNRFGIPPGAGSAAPAAGAAPVAERNRPVSPIIEEISLSSDEDFDDLVDLDALQPSEISSNLPVVVRPPMAEVREEEEGAPPRRRWPQAHRLLLPRLTVSWPLLSLIVGLGLVATLVAVAVFFPYGNFKPDVERQLGAFLRQPVSIGELRVTLTPRPNLTLDQVVVGEGKITVGLVKLMPGLSALLRGRVEYSARMDGVEVNAGGLALLSRARGAAAPGPVLVSYADFSSLTFNINDWRLDHLHGNIAVDAQGIQGANIRSEDDSLKVGVAGDGKSFHVTISAVDWREAGRNVHSLDGEGDMDAAGLRLNRLEGEMLGGLFKGSVSAAWTPLVPVTGEVTLTRVDAGQLASLLSLNLPLRGELSGTIRASGPAGDWQSVANPPQLQADFRVVRGQLDRFDFGMAVRSAGSGWSRGGVTSFESLSLGVLRDGQTWHLNGISIVSGAMSVAGNATVAPDRSLSGAMQVSLGDKLSAPVILGGTFREPLMRSQRVGW